ncbi:MAG: DUF45 domain-containing protein [Prevotella sp.]|nr:DUF45 domain-containing protein [Prevotella sp.]MBR1449971.1 DUF45 domain-containing protein [Prevotella sp.]
MCICHQFEPSHNPRFYALMDRYFPRWREARKETRRICRMERKNRNKTGYVRRMFRLSESRTSNKERNLSDMHDENVIRSNKTDTIFVVDCDIRINMPELRQGGTRT